EQLVVVGVTDLRRIPRVIELVRAGDLHGEALVPPGGLGGRQGGRLGDQFRSDGWELDGHLSARTTFARVSSAGLRARSNARAISSSPRRIARARSTPGCPAAASDQRIGRPTRTPCAP